MATQIIQKPVSSLEKTLESLTNHAVNQLHKRRETEQNYESLRSQGYPEHVAKALAPATEKERLSFMKMYEPNPDYQQAKQSPSNSGFNPNIPEDQLKGFVDFLNTPEEGQGQPGMQKPPMPGLENLIPQLKQQQPGKIPTQAPKSMAPMQPQAPMQQAAPIAQPSAPEANVPAVRRRMGGVGGITPYQQEKLKREDRKEKVAEQEKVMPFVEKEIQRAKDAEDLREKLLEMEQIALKHKDKFPGFAKSNLPTVLLRNSDIRRYAALASEVVTAKSNALRGTPTNFRTKLIEQGKINLNQPYDTQLRGIRAELKNTDKLLEVPKLIEKFREENDGYYPRDIASKVFGKNSDQELERLATQDFLSFPEAYQEGTEIEDNGKRYVLNNGKWSPK